MALLKCGLYSWTIFNFISVAMVSGGGCYVGDQLVINEWKKTRGDTMVIDRQLTVMEPGGLGFVLLHATKKKKATPSG